MIRKIDEILSSKAYPGRGIIVGCTPDGSKAAIAYFIMGRSENSRNRVFVKAGNGIRTQAFDENLLTDPSLIIYNPMKGVLNKEGYRLIVSNGNQTDTILDLMDGGKTFEQALQTIEFEPDKPFYTPRVSSIINLSKGSFDYKMSIAKTADGNPDSCSRFVYSYAPLAGQGHFIHTYGDDDKVLPSFCGEPYTIEIDEDFEAFSRAIWNSLNEDNKVSLFTRFINLKTGEASSRIFNKNKK